MIEDYSKGIVLLMAQKCFNEYKKSYCGEELEGYFEGWVKANLEHPNDKFVKEIWKEFIELMHGR